MIVERAMNGRVEIRRRKSGIERRGSVLIRLLLGVDVLLLLLHLARCVVAVLRVETGRSVLLVLMLNRLLVELGRSRLGSKGVRSGCSCLSGELLLMGYDRGEVEVGRVVRRDEGLRRLCVVGVGEWLVVVGVCRARVESGHGRGSGRGRDGGIGYDGRFLCLLGSSLGDDLSIDDDDGLGVAMLLRVFRSVNS